jgi:ParB family chromosome partitioning protein
MALALKDRLALQAAGETQLTFDPTGRDEPRLAVVPLRLIDPDPNQPRQDLGDLADLAASIREHGVIQPLIVEAAAGGRYRLLAGERRFTACRSVGLETAPCVIRTVAEHSRLALQLIENLHRKDLHPVEEAGAYRRLMTEFNLQQDELGRKLGKSATSICETLRILDLSPEVLAQVRTSEVATKSALLEMAKEADPMRQQALWQRVQAGQASVADLKAERRRKSPSAKRPTVWKAAVGDAIVVVRFRRGEVTPERITAALQGALEATQAGLVLSDD